MRELSSIAIKSLRSCVGNRFISHFSPSSWGFSVLIMEKNGKAVGRIYWFNDDNTTVYLDWLNVDKDIRKKGFGTELQKIREQIGIQLGAKVSCLWAYKNTWMYAWYKRRGYKYFKIYEKEENAIWMQKELV